jgi:diaminopropionate ammonia-lyase
LGAGYAVAVELAKIAGIDTNAIAYQTIVDALAATKREKVLFATATDGNHGRGLAWAARIFGQKAAVFMPKGSSVFRIQAIEKEGAQVFVIDGNYEDAVRAANQYAKKHGGILVQDTAFEGYEEIPKNIMQGYLTMADEAFHQLEEKGVKPTHIFVQAGVGSFAAAVIGYFAQKYQDNLPRFVVVEPATVNCIYLSAKAGHKIIVEGDYYTLMAGLSCGDPNHIALDLLLNTATDFLAVDDEAAVLGMRTLAKAKESDPVIVSGESGAGALGAVRVILEKPEFASIKKALSFDSHSQLLFFSTEGDTDPENYQKIIKDK